MSETTPENPTPGPRRRRRWLTWLGLLLIAAAVVRHFIQLSAPQFAIRKVYWPLRVPDGLKPLDRLPVEPGALRGSNVIIVSLDTTRADHLACYGNEDIKTPVMDALARTGVMFTQARAAAPTTVPSHTSIMTGLYPVNHGARVNGLYRLADEKTTLAEAFSAAGYATAAAVSAFVLDAQFGLDQGFDLYQDDLTDESAPLRYRYRERPAEKTIAAATAWLDGVPTQDPYFLWIHLFDPHADYTPPPPFDQEYADNPYNGEIAYVDHCLQKLVDTVAQRGQTDSTLIVIVADHGDGLDQHGELSHGALLYDDTIHIPLIMNCGRHLNQNHYVDSYVSQVDIAPTVLSLVGLPVLPTDGRDLTQPPPPDRLIYSETLHARVIFGWAPVYAAIQGGLKYMHSPSPELYDLTADPGETKNLLAQRPNDVAALLSRLRAFFGAEIDTDVVAESNIDLSIADQRRLEALGYVGLSDAQTRAATSGPRPDPKDMMPVMRELDEVVFARTDRPVEERIADIEALVERYPDFTRAYKYLGDAYFEAGEMDKAMQTYQQAVKMDPGATHSLLGLGMTYMRLQRGEDAIETFKTLIEIYPDEWDARYFLAIALRNLRRFEESAEHLRYILDHVPKHKRAADVLVQVYTSMGRRAEAEKILADWLARSPERSNIRAALAKSMTQRQEYASAESLLQERMAAAPDDAETAANLALFWIGCPDVRFHRPLDGVRLLERLNATAKYQDCDLIYALSTAYTMVGRLDEAIAMSERGIALAEEQGQKVLGDSIAALLEDQKKAKGQQSAPREGA